MIVVRLPEGQQTTREQLDVLEASKVHPSIFLSRFLLGKLIGHTAGVVRIAGQ